MYGIFPFESQTPMTLPCLSNIDAFGSGIFVAESTTTILCACPGKFNTEKTVNKTMIAKRDTVYQTYLFSMQK